jgi:hypothetical protein
MSIAALLLFNVACENDVDINADFEEKTVVFGLLDVYQDTQYVKINRTFLDDNVNAINLAKDPNRLYYDTLDVKLTEGSTNKEITLNKIFLPKDSGLFTREENQVYFTNEPLLENEVYQLSVIKPDGSVTAGNARTVSGVSVSKPSGSLKVQFVSFPNGNDIVDEYTFVINTGANGSNVAEIELRFNFRYREIVGIDSTLKKVSFPLTRLFNPNLESGKVIEYIFTPSRFFQYLEEQVPATVNPTKKIIEDLPVEIEVYVADPDFAFYRELNGPIDGLAQVRPDFTNVDNGIGLFSSRSSKVFRADFHDLTKNYIISHYKTTRNFSFP